MLQPIKSKFSEKYCKILKPLIQHFMLNSITSFVMIRELLVLGGQ